MHTLSLKYPQIQSRSIYFSKFSWGGMPPDPPSMSMLCMLIFLRTIAKEHHFNYVPSLLIFFLMAWPHKSWLLRPCEVIVGLACSVLMSLMLHLSSTVCITLSTTMSVYRKYSTWGVSRDKYSTRWNQVLYLSWDTPLYAAFLYTWVLFVVYRILSYYWTVLHCER